MTKFEEFITVTMIVISCWLSYGLGQTVTERTVKANLIEECKALLWEHEPPVRPTCEEMANLRMKGRLAK